MKTGTLLALTTTTLLAASALADQARVDTYQSQLRAVRPAELPGETARLVANKGDAADAVTAAVSLNGPSAALVVGSVAKSNPQSAAAAAATAVKLQPRLITPIVTAAVKASPGEVTAIVSESCRARPASFYNVGVAAALAAPKASDKVVPAVTAGVPSLKPVVAQARKDFKAANRTASIALLLKHTENLVAAMAKKDNLSVEAFLARSTEDGMTVKVASLATGPSFVQLPPFVPGGTPGEIRTGGTSEVDPNDRDYSSP